MLNDDDDNDKRERERNGGREKGKSGRVKSEGKNNKRLGSNILVLQLISQQLISSANQPHSPYGR